MQHRGSTPVMEHAALPIANASVAERQEAPLLESCFTSWRAAIAGWLDAPSDETDHDSIAAKGRATFALALRSA
jgi:hypothetical protein